MRHPITRPRSDLAVRNIPPRRPNPHKMVRLRTKLHYFRDSCIIDPLQRSQTYFRRCRKSSRWHSFDVVNLGFRRIPFLWVSIERGFEYFKEFSEIVGIELKAERYPNLGGRANSSARRGPPVGPQRLGCKRPPPHRRKLARWETKPRLS